jgi:hypothetical protein
MLIRFMNKTDASGCRFASALMKSNNSILFVALLLAPLHAQAHQMAHEAVPDDVGTFALHGAVALTHLSSHSRLPSQGLPGYLRLGDPGEDLRGSNLEHAVLGLAYRFLKSVAGPLPRQTCPHGGSDDADAATGGLANKVVDAQLDLGAHGADPAHVQTAWLQAQGGGGYGPALQISLGVGRKGPSLGSVIGTAGHFDRFSAMPLAKAAVLNGDGIDDGAELGFAQLRGQLRWQGHVSVWSSQTFPGSAGSAAFPSLHTGVQWLGAAQAFSADAFTAQLKPQGRGSRLANAPGGHSHTAPVCNASLQDVVCFDGRSRITGLSAQWVLKAARPLTVELATLQRDEDGTLQSRNGSGQYAARTQGDWLQAVWAFAPRWQTGWRAERLQAQHTLTGPGASLLAAEAGLNAYAPQRRLTALISYAARPWLQLSIEAGRESAGQQNARFVALRLVMHWQTRELASAMRPQNSPDFFSAYKHQPHPLAVF